MIRRVALALVPLLALSACAGSHRLPEPSGPWRPLNTGQWVPTRDDLRGPRLPLPPVQSPNAAPAPVAGAPRAGGTGA